MLSQFFEPFAGSNHHVISQKMFEFGHKIEDFMHEHKIDKAITEVKEFVKDSNKLEDDATIQFAAGLLYGASKGTIDKRDYLLDCSYETRIAKRQLYKAFEDYNAGKHEEGNKHMKKATPWWRLQMVTCWKTTKYFNKIDEALDTFFAKDDWSDIVSDNYSTSQAVIDQNWSNTLKTWNEGVYFNAGMFYAYTFSALAASEQFDADMASLLDF